MGFVRKVTTPVRKRANINSTRISLLDRLITRQQSASPMPSLIASDASAFRGRSGIIGIVGGWSFAGSGVPLDAISDINLPWVIRRRELRVDVQPSSSWLRSSSQLSRDRKGQPGSEMLEKLEDSIGHCSDNRSFHDHNVSRLNWNIGAFALGELVKADLGHGLLPVGAGPQ